MVKKIRRTVVTTIFLLFFVSVFFITKIENPDFSKTKAYKSTMAAVDTLPAWTNNMREGKNLKAGWAKKEIMPEVAVNMAGYGWKSDWESVKDSLYVRTMVFDNGLNRVAMINYDLLIVHPALAKKIEDEIHEADLSIDFIYFGATHTHSSYGGWAPGLGAWFTLGGEEEEIVSKLVRQTLNAVAVSIENLKETKVGYTHVDANELVFNKLKYSGVEDSLARCVRFSQRNGEEAVLFTYSAHPTLTSIDDHYLSADYPGLVINNLENDEVVDFGMFMAGGVGAHIAEHRDGTYGNMLDYARELTDEISPAIQSITPKTVKALSFNEVEVAMGNSQYKITSTLKLRDWAFDYVFGNLGARLKILRIGDIFFIGTPCDFSGEITPELTNKINIPKANIITTSFNGGYIGYLTPDKYYAFDHRETFSMHWFGPTVTDYYTTLIAKMANKL